MGTTIMGTRGTAVDDVFFGEVLNQILGNRLDIHSTHFSFTTELAAPFLCSDKGSRCHTVRRFERSGLEPVFRRNLLPDSLHGRLLELDDMPAMSADQVVMITLHENVVILRFVSKASRLSKPDIA